MEVTYISQTFKKQRIIYNFFCCDVIAVPQQTFL